MPRISICIMYPSFWFTKNRKWKNEVCYLFSHAISSGVSKIVLDRHENTELFIKID